MSDYVLLVDSDPDYADDMETVLSGAGIELVVAVSPAQAVQLVKTITPRALLLNLDRPPRESMRLLSDIHARGIDPPVLWITSHLTHAGMERVRGSGGRGLLFREADTVSKVCAVRAMLNGDYYFPPIHTHPATPGAKAIAESERIIKLLHQYAREG
jgi:DNA-binding NarL/FixJ family response regulator